MYTSVNNQKGVKIKNWPDESRPKSISCSRTGTTRQMLSEVELGWAELCMGSAVKWGSININDPIPMITAPANAPLNIDLLKKT